MSTRTKGEHVKSDFQSGGLLAKIPTTSVVKERKRHPIYYAILQALDFDNLAPIQKPIAILFAAEYCRCLPDCQSSEHPRPADYSQLLKLFNALQPKEQPRSPKASTAQIEDKSLDLKELMDSLDSD